MLDKDQGPIERLEKKLARWRNEAPPVRRSRLSPPDDASPTSWSPPADDLPTAAGFLLSPWLKNLLIVAIFFFIAMAGVVAGVFYWGGNQISIGNVFLEIEGPKTAKAGQSATLNLTLDNQNSVPLEFVDLIIEYPSGTRAVDDPAKALTRDRRQLGTINPGEVKRQTVAFVPFGEEGISLPIKVSMEYRLQDSNAIFDKSATYQLEITDAPISLTLAVPEAVSTGQELTLRAELVSDAPAPIKELNLLLHYPSGFEFTKASPAPLVGHEGLWLFPELAPGQKQVVSITGVMKTPDSDLKAFRAEAGSSYENRENRLAVIYDSAVQSVAIEQSFINLTARINGRSEAEYIAASREDLRVTIDWVNNLPDPIADGELTVALAGEAIDRGTVNVEDGFYRSSDNLIIWNQTSVPALEEIAPGAAGQVQFSFAGASLTAAAEQALRQPTARLEVRFRGRHLSPESEGRLIESELERQIKFNSVVQLAARALHRTGPFENTGPLPPRVGERTTYSVVWSLANSSNDLEAAEVRAKLPIYLEWVGPAPAAAEPLEFVPNDGGGGEVIWRAGLVRAGAGFTLPAREAAFQVALTPSLGQVDTAPVLTSAPVFQARDSFTGQKLTGELRRPLDTYLISEAGFEVGEDKVVE